MRVELLVRSSNGAMQGGEVGDGAIGELRSSERHLERELLAKLSRLEAKMDMLTGNGQPGRMTLAESRLTQLERNDVRRTVIE